MHLAYQKRLYSVICILSQHSVLLDRRISFLINDRNSVRPRNPWFAYGWLWPDLPPSTQHTATTGFLEPWTVSPFAVGPCTCMATGGESSMEKLNNVRREARTVVTRTAAGYQRFIAYRGVGDIASPLATNHRLRIPGDERNECSRASNAMTLLHNVASWGIQHNEVFGIL
jgi:hypothetical protein